MTLATWRHDPQVAVGAGLDGDLEQLCAVARGDGVLDDGAIDIVVFVTADDGGDDETIRSMVAHLRADPTVDAAGRLIGVTDAVKRVDPTGVIIETVDRSTLAMIGRPVAIRSSAARTGAINRIVPI